MQVNPYLMFDGQCEAAFKFYEQCLGGKIEAMMTYKESPMAEETPLESRDRIMHASLNVGEQVLMGSDEPSDRMETPQGFYVSLHFKDPVEAERIFYALTEKGTVKMPLQETFWAARFGMLVDRFGTPWMINCDPIANPT
ncbi:MAG: VOC family protein [Cyanosarcina radialis HA8281-LM2]|jgi:PhnB protein|nr:VOC family protein [Cyanosarcina radialis HA8281-LM2]